MPSPNKHGGVLRRKREGQALETDCVTQRPVHFPAYALHKSTVATQEMPGIELEAFHDDVHILAEPSHLESQRKSGYTLAGARADNQCR